MTFFVILYYYNINAIQVYYIMYIIKKNYKYA